MSASNATENSVLLLILNATTWDGVAENDTSSPVTDWYVALHTSDPGEGGTQATNEISYTGYARVPVARDSSGWTVSGSTGSNTDEILWGACSAGSGTATHFSIGPGSSGATAIIVSGALTASLPVSAGITPRAAASALTVTCE